MQRKPTKAEGQNYWKKQNAASDKDNPCGHGFGSQHQ
jgi:hypothetical protein